MRLPRILWRRCTTRELACLSVFTVMLFIYLYRLHSGSKRGGWPTREQPDAALSYDNRVRLEDGLTKPDSAAKELAMGLLGQVRNREDKYVRDIGYKQHAFNAFVSNQIGLHRFLPDSRHKVCPRTPTSVEEQLPTISVIMCFYNEHKMTLFRSVQSVLTRTPKHLLREIILVDDYSDLPELEFHLVNDLHSQLKSKHIRYIRNERREGLIRSRVFGAREATADVLIFLDSHIEVNEQWSEPLLRLIKAENSTLAVPVMDLISADTFEYTNSPLVRGGFNWGLHYNWVNLPEGTLSDVESFKEPFISPTMAGGLFAINRQYFTHIGEYDMGMDVWGGENLEISFRVWQCGGAIKIVPCSRVGHVFRSRRPYGAPDGSDTLKRNSLRLAHIWMDDYKQYYIDHLKGDVDDSQSYGDISASLALRERLHCHDFAWYLKNIYPELRLPGDTPAKDGKAAPGMPSYQPWHSRKRNYRGKPFLLRLLDSELCAAVAAPKVKGFWKRGSHLSLETCERSARNQLWYQTDRAEMVLDKLLCLEASATGGADVYISKCHEMLGDQQWHHSQNGPFYNAAAGTCLKAADLLEGAHISLDLCSKNSLTMAWEKVYIA